MLFVAGLFYRPALPDDRIAGYSHPLFTRRAISMGKLSVRPLMVIVAIGAFHDASLQGAEGAASGNSTKRDVPLYRIDATDFNAGESDIRAICDSAARQLWRHFPDYDLEPFVVTRGRSGPIVLRLDTSDSYWSQYAYQFGHEFCHILAGFKPGAPDNLWFEETLCEMASLYVLRGMAREWKDNPPYRNWSSYRDSLRGYVDDVMLKRRHLREINTLGLPAFYRKYAAELAKNPTNRDLNGAMAIVLLPLFEEQPEHWEAVRWLNHEARPENEPFAAYLTRWHNAVPERHREFVREIASLYGVELPAAAQ
jgi:hypothetical protein